MDEKKSTYIRLPGRRWGVIRRASLWDAGDHLLSISGTTFSERYRRYYYRDIKSIVVQKGARIGSIGAILLTLWVSLPLAAAAMGSPVSAPAFRWVLLVPLLLLCWMIYVNLARSCRVYVFTAVSSEELPAIFRRRAAAKTLPKILNKIAEAQGAFDSEQTGLGVLPVAAARGAEELSAPPTRRILYSVVSFSLLLLASTAFAYWYRSESFTPASLWSAKMVFLFLNTLEVGAGVWALFTLFRVRSMAGLRICVFAGLGVLALRSYSLIMVMSFMHQREQMLTEVISNVHLRYWVGTADCALSLIVALAALICLMLGWQDSEPRELVSIR